MDSLSSLPTSQQQRQQPSPAAILKSYRSFFLFALLLLGLFFSFLVNRYLSNESLTQLLEIKSKSTHHYRIQEALSSMTGDFVDDDNDNNDQLMLLFPLIKRVESNLAKKKN